ncbi:hypothetical protein BDN70DRAFT_879026 [Pholiota conissans]|uniref:Uncharacterized protein n=1 Tax=Pholiota conissans TaxID=109636 RepID=A0A9P6D0Z8_9AGAR|nr:hypothetical protein BDN70DRAFT_879026 [Pholiota conissans]
MTRYEIQQIRSKLVVHESDTTFTVIDSPLTITYTLEQGATSVYASAPPFITQQSDSGGRLTYEGIKQNCSLDLSQHSGECFEVDEDPDLVFASGSESSSTTIATSTRTFSGPLIPLATFVTSDAKPSSQFMKAPVILLLGAILAMIAI